MTFHEATKIGDFKKIVGFIRKQPELSVPRLCMNPLLKELSPQYALKVVRDGLDMGDGQFLKGFYAFWAEDKENTVRAAIFIRFKEIQDNPQYSKILHWAFCTVDEADYQNDDHTFFEELIVGMANKFGKGGVGEFRVAGKFYPWMKRIFGKYLTLREEVKVPNYTTHEPMDMQIVIITWDHMVRS